MHKHPDEVIISNNLVGFLLYVVLFWRLVSYETDLFALFHYNMTNGQCGSTYTKKNNNMNLLSTLFAQSNLTIFFFWNYDS